MVAIDPQALHALQQLLRGTLCVAPFTWLTLAGCTPEDLERKPDADPVERCGPVEALQVSFGLPGSWRFEVHTCETTAQCPSGEQCFLVDSIGLCAPPRGVTCAEHTDRAQLTCYGDDPAAPPIPGPCACGTDEECYVMERSCSCQPAVAARCMQPGCSSNDECGADELCVPGLLHPDGPSNNQCKGPTPDNAWGCRHDADCKAEPCGRCVFSAARPLQAGPPAEFVRADCVYADPI